MKKAPVGISGRLFFCIINLYVYFSYVFFKFLHWYGIGIHVFYDLIFVICAGISHLPIKFICR